MLCCECIERERSRASSYDRQAAIRKRPKTRGEDRISGDGIRENK